MKGAWPARKSLKRKSRGAGNRNNSEMDKRTVQMSVSIQAWNTNSLDSFLMGADLFLLLVFARMNCLFVTQNQRFLSNLQNKDAKYCHTGEHALIYQTFSTSLLSGRKSFFIAKSYDSFELFQIKRTSLRVSSRILAISLLMWISLYECMCVYTCVCTCAFTSITK